MSQSRWTSLDDPETLRQFVRRLREGIYITNDRGQILDANPACLEILGLPTLDAVRRKALEHQLLEQSRRDPLTGCYNRRYLAELSQRLAGDPRGAGFIVFDPGAPAHRPAH